MDDSSRPIFLQLSERLESDILSGQIAEESAIPSINELAAFHRINPATALKAVNLLVEQGTLYKKRGIGMFVVAGARKQLATRHLTKFEADFVEPLIVQAKKLGISNAEIIQMIEKRNN
jgi:GntR family transcriptional regulator